MSEITKEILEQAIQDYSEAVEWYSNRNTLTLGYLFDSEMFMGLCWYFRKRHGIVDISDMAPKGKTCVGAWWVIPCCAETAPEIIKALTVRLNFLKDKLKEMQS